MSHFAYGGQALIEGVMMRGRDAIAMAVRSPDGRIAIESERLGGRAHGSRLASLPFLRGLVVLYEQLIVGMTWLYRSAAVSVAEAGYELGKRAIAFSLAIALAISVGLFFVLPLLVAQSAGAHQSNLGQQLLEGALRLVIFLGYLILVGRTKQMRRLFRYHGAEHMAIHALEAGEALTIANVHRHPTAHPRCGTEFLVIVLLLSVLAFALVGHGDLPFMIASRVVLVPVLAALSYEILRFNARHREHLLFRLLAAPGIWVQMITTKQPDDSMIEVAIAALSLALVADGETVPAGSLELATVPIPLVIAQLRAAAANPPLAVDPMVALMTQSASERAAAATHPDQD